MTYYTGNEQAQVGAYIRRMVIGLVIVTAGVLAVLVISRIARLRWLSVGLTLVWGAALIFLWGMKLSPALAYRKLLQDIAQGTPRTESGMVTVLTDNDTYHEGTTFSILRINVDEKMDPKGERMFYVDGSLPRPAIAAGDAVVITAHGNYLTGWQRTDADSR